MSDTLELRQPVETGDDEGMHTAPPPFEGVKWRIKIGDKEYGPYPRTRLIDFLKEGRVQAGTFIACGTDTDYHRADHHPNLRWDFKGPKKRKFGDPAPRRRRDRSSGLQLFHRRAPARRQ